MIVPFARMAFSSALVDVNSPVSMVSSAVISLVAE